MPDVMAVTAEDLSADTAWWRIYDDSFPANEREPPEVILGSVLRGVGMAFRARRDSRTCGLATTHLLKDPPAVFLVYLAVAREQRGGGIGAGLFERAWELSAARLTREGLRPLGLLWEVDPPTAVAADAPARRRRIAFFERQGGRLLERSYLQPPVDGIAPVPMSLMFRPAEGQPIPDSETVNSLVRSVYFEKYGATNGIETSILETLLNRR